MKNIHLSFALGLLVSTSCQAQTLDTGATSDGSAPSQDADDGGAVSAPVDIDAGTDVGGAPIYGTATGPEAFTPAQAAAAREACAAPHGPAMTTATVGAVRAVLQQGWLLCSLQMPFAGASYYSIRYRGDGTWSALLPDARGGLVEAVAVDGIGTYHIGSGNPGDGAAYTGDPFYMDYPGGGTGPVANFFAFEQTPLRMRIETGSYGATEWFVGLGGGN